MRLIDADSLLQVIRKNIPKNPHDEYQEGQEIGLSMADGMVCNEPTVDAEPIIRCKDCKYWQEPVEQDGYKYPSQCTRDERAYMEECAILMDADDFCSRGEKKR